MGTVVATDWHLQPGYTDGVPFAHFWLTQDGNTVTGTWGTGEGTSPPLTGTVDGNTFTFVIHEGLGCQSPGTGTIRGHRLDLVMSGFVGPLHCSSSTVTATLEKQSDDPTLRKPRW